MHDSVMMGINIKWVGTRTNQIISSINEYMTAHVTNKAKIIGKYNIPPKPLLSYVPRLLDRIDPSTYITVFLHMLCT